MFPAFKGSTFKGLAAIAAALALSGCASTEDAGGGAPAYKTFYEREGAVVRVAIYSEGRTFTEFDGLACAGAHAASQGPSAGSYAYIGMTTAQSFIQSGGGGGRPRVTRGDVTLLAQAPSDTGFTTIEVGEEACAKLGVSLDGPAPDLAEALALSQSLGRTYQVTITFPHIMMLQ